MPEKEVYINEIEVEILQVFVKRNILHDTVIIASLQELIEKLNK